MRADQAIRSAAIWRRPVLAETLILTLLCVLDTVSTLYVVRSGLAREANPLLVGSLAHSDAAFLLVKGSSFIVPIVLLEGLRDLRPRFVRKAMGIASVGYLAIYVVGSMKV